MDTAMHMGQTQKQIITQKQLQSLNILQMNGQELESFLQNEHLENPMLEYTGSSGMNGTLWNPDTQQDPISNIAQGFDPLREVLRSQIRIRQLCEKELRVMEYLIDAVEDSGYFTQPLEEVATACNVSLAMVEKCLQECKQLEPAGIFSKDLTESLLKQLEVLGIEDYALNEMVTHHLSDIASGNIGNISRALTISTAQVRKYILLIGSLSPRPADGYGTQEVAYTVPDILVTFENGAEITLADNWVEDYRISDYYLRLMQETKDAELQQYFKERYHRVRFIMEHIKQRRETLLDVTRILVERQEAFLKGKGHLQPVTMTDVATRLGVHTSTVSRAVRGKYIQFPGKTMAMKELFSASAVKKGEQTREVNAGEIKERIRRLVQEEDKRHPYSDEALKEHLAVEGIRISRRAVAKYREELLIKGSFQRKE